MSVLVKISFALFVAAEVFVVVAIGASALPLAGAWALAAVGVVVVARLVHSPTARVALTALLMAACLVLTAEEGLFFLPAATALFAAAVTARRHGRLSRAGWRHS